jgi:hypothetical protein
VRLGNPVTVGSNGDKASALRGRGGHRPIVLGEEFQEPNVIRLNEGVGEHVRTKISPQLKQRG